MTKKFEKASGKTSPKITKTLNVAVTIVSKVMEVGHWIAAVAMILLAIFGFSGGAFPPAEGGSLGADFGEVSVYGFEATLSDGVSVNYPAMGWFSVAGVIIFALMAMVFRNIYLITKNSQEKTPFTEDNMRMVKELGIFFIAIPVVGLIFSTIIRLATGIELSVDTDMVIVGLIMFYLTQIFARGVELEDDVKDLV